MAVDGFYLSGNYPQTLAEMETDIYKGNAADLIDSLSTRLDAVNNASGIPNVNAAFSYTQYADGSIDVTGITVANASDYRVFVSHILFVAEGNSGVLMSGLNQTYSPNPTRYVPQINADKFMTIDPHTSRTSYLTPSGNPNNANNHFGPASLQSLTAKVFFVFQAEPLTQMLEFNLIP